MVPNENCLEKATHSIGVAKSCSGLHPQGRELQRHWKIQKHCLTTRTRLHRMANKEAGQPGGELSTGISVGLTCGRFHSQGLASSFAQPTTRFPVLLTSTKAILLHILSGCKTVLSQGHYRLPQDQVLRKLAEVLRGCQQQTTTITSEPHQLCQGRGTKIHQAKRDSKAFPPEQEWDRRVDFNRQL